MRGFIVRSAGRASSVRDMGWWCKPGKGMWKGARISGGHPSQMRGREAHPATTTTHQPVHKHNSAAPRVPARRNARAAACPREIDNSLGLLTLAPISDFLDIRPEGRQNAVPTQPAFRPASMQVMRPGAMAIMSHQQLVLISTILGSFRIFLAQQPRRVTLDDLPRPPSPHRVLV